MGKRIKIHVTSEDIRDGQCINDGCPVALALKRTTGKVHNVGFLTLMDKNWKRIADAPRSVQRFVRRFDANKPVQPFTFFLQPYA